MQFCISNKYIHQYIDKYIDGVNIKQIMENYSPYHTTAIYVNIENSYCNERYSNTESGIQIINFIRNKHNCMIYHMVNHHNLKIDNIHVILAFIYNNNDPIFSSKFTQIDSSIYNYIYYYSTEYNEPIIERLFSMQIYPDIINILIGLYFHEFDDVNLICRMMVDHFGITDYDDLFDEYLCKFNCVDSDESEDCMQRLNMFKCFTRTFDKDYDILTIAMDFNNKLYENNKFFRILYYFYKYFIENFDNCNHYQETKTLIKKCEDENLIKWLFAQIPKPYRIYKFP